MSEQQRPHAPHAAADATVKPGVRPVGSPPREIPSDQIFAGTHEVLIRHAGEVYRLRLTRNGKLILHK